MRIGQLKYVLRWLLSYSIFVFILLSSLQAIANVAPCGQPLNSYQGIAAYSNGPKQGSDNSCGGHGGDYGLQYQCVEYIRRFYNEALGIDTKSGRWPHLNAVDFFGKTANPVGLNQYPNGNSTVPPAPNDILVFKGPTPKSPGHVAIVTGVTSTSVNIIEQNWSKTGTATLDLVQQNGIYTINPRKNYTVMGWLRSGSSIPTGITKCYDNTTVISCPASGQPFYNQDGQYISTPMNFTDNGNGTITDNVTGLMWQKEDDSQTRLMTDSISYCDTLTLGGYSDWRLPNARELQGIDDYGQPPPLINPLYFPNTKGVSWPGYWSGSGLGYWSSSYRIFQPNYITMCSLLGAIEGCAFVANFEQTNEYTRCVRGQSAQRSFTDNGNGTITDNVTALMWQQEDDGQTRDWETALTYCSNLTLGGYSDWSLPNVKEIESTESYYSWYGGNQAEIGPNFTNIVYYDPIAGATPKWYWSSSSYTPSPIFAWRLSSGHGIDFQSKTIPSYVRCIRNKIPKPQEPPILPPPQVVLENSSFINTHAEILGICLSGYNFCPSIKMAMKVIPNKDLTMCSLTMQMMENQPPFDQNTGSAATVDLYRGGSDSDPESGFIASATGGFSNLALNWLGEVTFSFRDCPSLKSGLTYYLVALVSSSTPTWEYDILLSDNDTFAPLQRYYNGSWAPYYDTHKTFFFRIEN